MPRLNIVIKVRSLDFKRSKIKIMELILQFNRIIIHLKRINGINNLQFRKRWIKHVCQRPKIIKFNNINWNFANNIILSELSMSVSPRLLHPTIRDLNNVYLKFKKIMNIYLNYKKFIEKNNSAHGNLICKVVGRKKNKFSSQRKSFKI